MKYYNVQNYIRYKNDVEKAIKRLPKKQWHEYTTKELEIKFLALTGDLKCLWLAAFNSISIFVNNSINSSCCFPVITAYLIILFLVLVLHTYFYVSFY